MTAACGSVDLALARVWARQGRRPSDADWGRIETMRGFAQTLEAARSSTSTTLSAWLDGLTPESDAAAVEARLRTVWPQAVAEAAGWMPERWQPAVQACALWSDLAPLQHLARGGEPPRWMQRDAAWQALIERRGERDPLAGSRWALLSSAWRAPEAIGTAWLAAWRARVPQAAVAPAQPLSAWLALMQAHAAAFVRADVHQAWPQRAALHGSLLKLLRRSMLDPAGLFAHLSLVALDLERLRAELLRRLLFPRWVPG